MKNTEVWISIRNDMQALYFYEKGARLLRFGPTDTRDRYLIATLDGASADDDTGNNLLESFYGTESEPQVLVDLDSLRIQKED